MKMALFQTSESHIEWLTSRIASLKIAVDRAAKEADKAMQGIHRTEWLDMNMIEEGTQEADDAWNKHIDWLCDYWASKRKELHKMQKALEIAKAQAG